VSPSNQTTQEHKPKLLDQLLSVFKARNPTTGEVAACKAIRYTSSTTPDERKALTMEVKLHSALNTHPNVLEFVEYLDIPYGSAAGEKFWAGAYMLLEYADAGDLFDKIGKFV
jgi:serine/threonine protein kinase